MTPKYKVVFIDWYGTLSVSKFWGHLDIEMLNIIENSLFGNLRDFINPWMKGEYTSEDIVRMFAKETGLSHKRLMKELVYSAQNMKFISGDIKDLVLKLRENGTKVVIATDNMDSFVRWTVPALELKNIFDDVLDSYSLKALKKDFHGTKSLFFDKFLKENKIKKGESIIIDDAEDKEGRIQKRGIDYKRIVHGEGITNELLELI